MENAWDAKQLWDKGKWYRQMGKINVMNRRRQRLKWTSSNHGAHATMLLLLLLML